MLNDLLSPRGRKRAYAIYAVLGLLLGAIQVGYGAASTDQPTWLTVTLAVFSFLGAGLGVTAAVNVSTGKRRAVSPRSDRGGVDGNLVAAIVVAGFLVYLLITLFELLAGR